MRRYVGVALMCLVACGGNGDAAPPSELTTAARDFSFQPDLWQPAAGTVVTVEVANEGNTLHTWVVLRGGVEVKSVDEVGDGDVLFEISIPIGETESGQLTVPPEGDYQVICTIAGHLESGMQGRLSVQPAP